MHANDMSLRLLHAVAFLVFLALTDSAVLAQTAQDDKSRLEAALVPERTLWVTDSDGREQRMRIVGVSGDVVTATVGDGTRQLAMSDIVRVRARQPDSVLNGALIGAGAALAAGLYLCNATEPWENCRDDYGPMLRIGALGAGIGIGVDALIRGRRTIYERGTGAARLRAAPIVGRHAGGLRVALMF